MNKFAVLTKNPETYFNRRLIEEVGKGGVLLINPWELAKPSLAGIKKILVRTTSVHGNEDLNFMKKHEGEFEFINPLKSQVMLRNKKLQYELMPKLGIPILPWLDIQTEENLVEDFIQMDGQEHFLIKPHRGQQGWGIKVLDEFDLRAWLHHATDKEYLLQPFVRGKEIRIFFIEVSIRILNVAL